MDKVMRQTSLGDWWTATRDEFVRRAEAAAREGDRRQARQFQSLAYFLRSQRAVGPIIGRVPGRRAGHAPSGRPADSSELGRADSAHSPRGKRCLPA
jgi:hypothetical protein